MKILLCTNRNPHFPTITEYVERALLALGHEVCFFEDRAYRLPGRVRQWLPALERLDLGALNRRLLALAGRERPDLCLVAGGHRILPQTVSRLRRQGVTCVLWTIDAPIHFAPIAAAAPAYDAVFCGGSEAVEILEALGVAPTWLPFACDPELHRPDPESAAGEEEVSALAFVGSYYPNRAELLAGLAGHDLTVWGPGWERLASGHPLAAKVHPGQIGLNEWRRIFSRAQVVLVSHYDDGRTPCQQASPKLYEAMACGAMVLCDAQADALRLFTPGRHFDIFRDPGELLAKVDHYLARPAERAAIAEQGRQEVLARHSYRHRLERLLATVGGEA